MEIFVCYNSLHLTIMTWSHHPLLGNKTAMAWSHHPLHGNQGTMAWSHHHTDHLALFRRTLGTRLESKYTPCWNYFQSHDYYRTWSKMPAPYTIWGECKGTLFSTTNGKRAFQNDIPYIYFYLSGIEVIHNELWTFNFWFDILTFTRIST